MERSKKRSDSSGRKFQGRKARPSLWGEIMGGFLQHSGLKKRIREKRVLDSWARAVGPAVAEQTQPFRLRNGVLEVKVTNSVWMQQLQFMKGLIIQKLGEQGGGDLADIRFSIGEVEPRSQEAEERERDFHLSEAERSRIREEVGQIRDPEVRELVSRVFAKALAAKKGTNRQ